MTVFYELGKASDRKLYLEFPGEALKDGNWYTLQCTIGIDDEHSIVILDHEMNYVCAELLSQGKYAEAVKEVLDHRYARACKAMEAWKLLSKKENEEE